jgi:hypothetical protein
MVTSFNTSVPAPSGGGGGAKKGNNTAIIVIGALVVGFLAYKFVYLPYKAKKDAEAGQ